MLFLLLCLGEFLLNSQSALPPPPNRRIAVTISIRPDESSIWVNGAKQNAFMLHSVFTYQHRHEVIFVNLDLGNVTTAQDDWNIGNFTVVRFREALEMDCPVWIESGMQLSAIELYQLQARGVKVATFRTGNDYFITAEMMIFKNDTSSAYGTVGYDGVWTLPSYEATMGFHGTLLQAPVEKVPYVWSPLLYDFTARGLTTRTRYSPRNNERKVVATFEPNVCIVKTSIIPLAIVEAFYRQYPHIAFDAHITNTQRIRDMPEFSSFVQHLDISNDGHVTFTGRFKIPWYLSDQVDVVLSHQWENALNFLYLDVLHAGYPLVHNSPFFKDCGYYYEGNSVEDAVKMLHYALMHHDENIIQYNIRSQICLEKWSVHNEENIRGYETLVDNLLARPHRFPQQK
eukprot:m.108722 g.108722  ORF g.108722 m.108722 type:complete len:400 (-) comp22646_c0_seq2:71-1270(-)